MLSSISISTENIHSLQQWESVEPSMKFFQPLQLQTNWLELVSFGIMPTALTFQPGHAQPLISFILALTGRRGYSEVYINRIKWYIYTYM